ncbi:MAG TPA: Mut7-C RNAse domain-containing protein [Candidatus Binataceae bacterium]|nr:Mut7-C RNAse domain-containing protein [Candidatus Binataceae bacterium]
MPDRDDNLRAVLRFAADRTLLRLARWLRLMGADVFCDPSLSAADTLHALAEGRAMLTRDKHLRTAAYTLYVERHLFRDQLLEVLSRFPFDPRPNAFTRCALCNNSPRPMVRRAGAD